jgi:hypothetical protein
VLEPSKGTVRELFCNILCRFRHGVMNLTEMSGSLLWLVALSHGYLCKGMVEAIGTVLWRLSKRWLFIRNRDTSIKYLGKLYNGRLGLQLSGLHLRLSS